MTGLKHKGEVVNLEGNLPKALHHDPDYKLELLPTKLYDMQLV